MAPSWSGTVASQMPVHATVPFQVPRRAPHLAEANFHLKVTELLDST